MNEKIRKLLVEAREQTKEGRHHAPLNVWTEKFAELIVRMCADAADMYEGKSDCIGDCVAEYMGYGEEEGITIWRNGVEE